MDSTAARTGVRTRRRSAAAVFSAGLAAGVFAAASVVVPAAVPGAVSAAAADTTGSSERAITDFAADVTITAGGTVRIREELTYRLGSEPSAQVERMVPNLGVIDRPDGPYQRDYGLSDVTVEDSAGVGPVDISTFGDSGAKLVRIGDGVDAETGDDQLTGKKTFVISYSYDTLLVADAGDRLRLFEQGERPRLYEEIVEPGGSVPVEAARVKVHAPGKIEEARCRTGEEYTEAPCESADYQGGEATFSSDRIAPGERFAIDLTLEGGSVDIAESAHTVDLDGEDGDSFALRDLPSALVGGIVLIVILGVAAWWVSNGGKFTRSRRGGGSASGQGR